MVERYADEIVQRFENLLSGFGLSSTQQKGWVTTNGQFPCFRASFDPGQAHPPVASVRFQVMVASKTAIDETIAAIGDGPLDDAFEQFTATMLTPILASFGYDDPLNPLPRVRLEVDGHRVDCCPGSIGIQQFVENPIEPPSDWLRALCSAYAEDKRDEDFSWFSAYCFASADGDPQATVKLKNEDWRTGQEATLSLDWPKRPGFYAARVFGVFVRGGAADAPA